MLFHQKKESIHQAKSILSKLSKLDNLTLDHKNQTLKDKFNDDLFYSENPLRKERVEDIEDICMLNSQSERLQGQLKEIIQKKKDYIENNRILVKRASNLKAKIKEFKRQKEDKGYKKKKLEVASLFKNLLKMVQKDDSEDDFEEDEPEIESQHGF